MNRLFTTIFCLIASLSFGQNNTPTITINDIQVDEIAETLSINYQLNDEDGDDCEVWLKFSMDGGTYFEMIPSENISGDSGDGISSSSDLTLTWNYADSGISIIDTHIQLFASDHQAVDIAEMLSQVDQSELQNTLSEVIGERHYLSSSEHLNEVRELMSSSFSNAGLQTEEHNFSFSGNPMQNIIARKSGAKQEDITFVIDGHFDCVPGSPGADDNGSAVAGVLEACRILSNYTFEHSIRFIGFDAEELGLVGSQRYVQNGIKPFEDIQGVLNFEMIGYYSDEPNSQTLPAGFGILFPEAAQAVSDNQFRGDFLTVVGNEDSNSLISAYVSASENYVPELKLIVAAVPGNGSIAPDLRRSDHAEFWDEGIQALMLTDGANFRNLNYHTPNDNIETLDFEFMANVVKATIAAAAELAIPISASYDEADLSIVLGVEEHNHHFPAELAIFPNPSDGLLSLQISNAEQNFRARLEVFDLSGKQVHREILNIPGGKSISNLNLQHLPVGAYILNLSHAEASTTLSFIVER